MKKLRRYPLQLEAAVFVGVNDVSGCIFYAEDGAWMQDDPAPAQIVINATAINMTSTVFERTVMVAEWYSTSFDESSPGIGTIGPQTWLDLRPRQPAQATFRFDPIVGSGKASLHLTVYTTNFDGSNPIAISSTLIVPFETQDYWKALKNEIAAHFKGPR